MKFCSKYMLILSNPKPLGMCGPHCLEHGYKNRIGERFLRRNLLIQKLSNSIKCFLKNWMRCVLRR